MNKLFLIAFSLLAISGAANAAAPKAGKHDTKQPIEINADTLEVFQQENRAVFTGNVVAIQGDVRLKSDRMNVFYSSDQGGDSKAKADANPAQGAIDRIEVTGNVFLSTPQETASGATGEYDVKAEQVRLNSNVVLTRENNVLKGDKLIYSFATGKSQLTAGGVTQNGKKERVRAIFVPSKKQP
ncbi:MAG: lipopolysaccharide transport periplasmic protein LptA [Rickettsiales bacterium]|jgi:lipopolysaccharide export system protein LptA|nr:lipopolysaccharide transport periplasmic protein LptA [Rickettsiales bacterium]